MTHLNLVAGISGGLVAAVITFAGCESSSNDPRAGGGQAGSEAGSGGHPGGGTGGGAGATDSGPCPDGEVLVYLEPGCDTTPVCHVALGDACYIAGCSCVTGKTIGGCDFFSEPYLQGSCEDAHPDSQPDIGYDGVGVDLPPVPVVDGGYPSCNGKSTPEAGPCCDHVVCYEPADGASCPDAANLTYEQKSSMGWQYGSCVCGAEGPFDPKTVPAEITAAEGDCCYVIGYQSCI